MPANKKFNLADGLPLQTREVQVRQEDIDQEKRTLKLSFSSEIAAERWWGIEILDHSSGSVRLKRLRTAGPLLLMHDRAKQIGKITEVTIGDDRRGYATVRFGKSQFAEEIWQDVLDGIRDTVSVGYMVHKAILEETDDKKGDTYRITDWEPIEVSLEPTPLDITVGVGRQQDDNGKKYPIKLEEREVQKMTPEEIKAKEAADKAAAEAAVRTVEVVKPSQAEIDKVVRDAQDAEVKRITEINQMGRTFKLEAEASQAIKDNIPVDQFREQVLNKMGGQQHIDTAQSDVLLTENEEKTYSLLRVIRAQLNKKPDLAGYELEISQEIAKLTRQDPQGFYVPWQILVNRAVGKVEKREITTSSGGTGLVGTDHLASEFIELLRNKAKVIGLGARVLTGLVNNISIPKQTGAATGYWVAESGDVTASDSAYGALALSIKTLGAHTVFTRNMLLQSSPSIEALVANDLVRVLSLAIDLAAIAGTGSSNQPTGITQTSGIGAVTGTSIGWDAIVEFETDVLAANAEDLGSMAYLAPATVNGLLKTRVKESGSPIFLAENGQMNGYPLAVSNQVAAATMLFGVWSEVIIGMWGGLDLLVDPFTSAADGSVYIRAFQSCDIGVRNAGAFSVSSNID